MFNQKIALNEVELESLSLDVQKLINVRKEIETKEAEIKELEKVEQHLSREKIPEKFCTYGVSSIKLSNGTEIYIEDKLFASLPKTDEEKKQIVLDFLEKNGGSGLIKDTIIITDIDNKMVEYLDNMNVSYTRNYDVNTNSLKAYFSELLGFKKGSSQSKTLDEIPKEANLFVYKETKIKGV